MNENRVWLITGTSSGFGRAVAEAALDRGDRVSSDRRWLNGQPDEPGAPGVAVRPSLVGVLTSVFGGRDRAIPAR